MKLILNADDFGQDQDTVAATKHCFANQSLSSATIMANMPASDDALSYAAAHPEFSFGVHLTFVRERNDSQERPLAPPNEVPALVGPDGRFLVSHTIRAKALLGLIPRVQIQHEAILQIQKAISSGVRVSHVDSHGHLHKFRPFREAIRNALGQFGIARVRGAQNLYLSKPITSPTVWLGGHWNRKLKKLFLCPEELMMADSVGSPNWPEQLLHLARGPVVEVGVHPGFAEPWRRADTEAVQKFAQIAKQRGHRLIRWSDIQSQKEKIFFP